LSRYAKFEYSLTARPCCAVDPIEKEEDRNKALATINTLLEKADKVIQYSTDAFFIFTGTLKVDAKLFVYDLDPDPS
jgi:hypothetical protein